MGKWNCNYARYNQILFEEMLMNNNTMLVLIKFKGVENIYQYHPAHWKNNFRENTCIVNRCEKLLEDRL